MESKVGIYKSSWEIILDFIKTNLPLSSKTIKKGYYYTNIDTLDKILNSGAIYSTNYRYLNDPYEWQYGYNCMKGRCQQIAEQYAKSQDETSIEKKFAEYMLNNILTAQHFLNDYPVHNNNVFRENYSEIFTISFTEEEDLISQWERYAKESGVVLELDFNPFYKKQIYLYQKTVQKREIPIEIEPQKVAYEEQTIKNISKTSMKAMYDYFAGRNLSEKRMAPYFHMFIRYVASYIKNAAYEQEKEIRLSCYPLINEATGKDEIDSSKIIYTIRDGVMIPHVPLYCGKKQDTELSCCGYPIRSIRVGPGYNQNSVFQGLIHRMECGEKKVFLLSEAEQTKIKNRHIIEGLACYVHIIIPKSKSNKDALYMVLENLSSGDRADAELKEEIKKIYSKSALKNLGDVSGELQQLKQNFYERVFMEYEASQFCTSEGILIKKSEIPYLFLN